MGVYKFQGSITDGPGIFFLPSGILEFCPGTWGFLFEDVSN
jgi:hypothetical protein